jgi:hypothetical protein
MRVRWRRVDGVEGESRNIVIVAFEKFMQFGQSWPSI